MSDCFVLYLLLTCMKKKTSGADKFTNNTQAYGITPSMSRKGNPYDNAPAENFFSILKTECIYRTKLSSFEEARSIIDEYIYFYNYQRIQTRTKLTPMELRCQFLNS